MTTTEPAGLFHLSSAADLTTAREQHPPTVGGLPAFYYWKDAIAVGTYTHPATGASITVTPDRLDRLAGTFGAMRTNGVAVPILMNHADTAESTLGWIVDVRRDGERLMELHQFVGENARDVGVRNLVSLGIDPDYVDGTGHRYGEAIVHSAVTPVPVVPGQGLFEPAQLPLLLSRVEARPEPKVDPGPVIDRIVTMKRDRAVAAGGVDAAVATELAELLAGSSKLLTLSRGDSSLAEAVFDLLARNKPVALGESTGVQVLTRMVPGDEMSPLRERMIALASGRKE